MIFNVFHNIRMNKYRVICDRALWSACLPCTLTTRVCRSSQNFLMQNSFEENNNETEKSSGLAHSLQNLIVTISSKRTTETLSRIRTQGFLFMCEGCHYATYLGFSSWLTARCRSVDWQVGQPCLLINNLDERLSIGCFGREPWSSGYGRRLMIQRLWVRIPAPYTGWTWHFFTLICCKNCSNVCLKKTENKRKRGQGWPIFFFF